MIAKIFLIFKWMILVLIFIVIASLLNDEDFYLEDFFLDVLQAIKTWSYAPWENYTYLIISIIGFIISLMSIKKNNSFWNVCFIFMVGLFVFNMI